MRRVFALFLTIVILVVSITTVGAHDCELNISYDKCEPTNTENGAIITDEKWYNLYLTDGLMYKHINDDTTTISYYFEDTYTDIEGNIYTWNSNISEELAEEIKKCLS